MPRFVILEHDWPARHWDLFLEAGPVLRSWRLLAEPLPGKVVPAEANAEHRPLFLDYEGPVSGGRGSVTRWAAGTFEWIADEPPLVIMTVVADRLSGIMRLEKRGGEWSFRYTDDREPSLVLSTGY
jgi:hypothetical protein